MNCKECNKQANEQTNQQADLRFSRFSRFDDNYIFISFTQELAEYMGMVKLNARFRDPTFQIYFEGLFPRDDPVNTRFAINFFTSIGKIIFAEKGDPANYVEVS